MREVKFKFFLDGKEVEEKLIDWNRNSTIRVDNEENVYVEYDKKEDILHEVDKYQQQENGGVLKGGEFLSEDWLQYAYNNATKPVGNNEYSRQLEDKYIEQIKDDVITNSNRGEKEMMSYLGGIKETEGKLHYELSWEFIEEMAKRMANNKSDKYPLYNWKKEINIQDLKDAINRHHIEVMKGNYQDGEEVLGHIVSYACNSMMLWEQLNKA